MHAAASTILFDRREAILEQIAQARWYNGNAKNPKGIKPPIHANAQSNSSYPLDIHPTADTPPT